jgi:hypothetical protein
MSLINDALKQARQKPPDNGPGGQPPLQPVPAPASTTGWLLPSIVIVLVIIAASFIGWAVMRRNANVPLTQAPPAPALAPQGAATIPVQTPVATPVATAPVAAAMPATTTTQAVQQVASVSPPPVDPPFVLKLQGIDYSPTAPSAILNGKTVHPGDSFHKYRVKSISKDAVTVIGPDNKEIQIELGN